MLIFLLLFLGFPSPLFLYLWYLYLSMFSSLREAETAKTLANSFRMVHAIFCSMPLMIINLATLYHQLLADGFEQYAMDIKELGKHFENVPMQLHAWAFILSVLNFVRGACLYNERQTMTMMFGLVALPFTLLTTMCRVHILALNIAFLEPEWTTILLAGYVTTITNLFKKFYLVVLLFHYMLGMCLITSKLSNYLLFL